MRITHFEEYDCIYDDNDNLIEVYENNILTCRYKYNDNHQVIREDNLFLGETITYKFNEFNKLVERNYYDYTLKGLQNAKYTDKFIYDLHNPNQLIKYNDETFTYDKNGKPLTFRNAKLKLSENNNLLNLSTYTFTYNKDNLRTSKTIGNQTTKFYRKNKKLAKQNGLNLMSFVYKDNQVTGFIINDNKYSYKRNFNGDIVGIYDNNHELICKYIYDCYGNHKLFTKQDNMSANIAEQNPFRFHNAYFDVETGLYFANGKYYDSEIGCYLNK